jgi:hypothetical protein
MSTILGPSPLLALLDADAACMLAWLLNPELGLLRMYCVQARQGWQVPHQHWRPDWCTMGLNLHLVSRVIQPVSCNRVSVTHSLVLMQLPGCIPLPVHQCAQVLMKQWAQLLLPDTHDITSSDLLHLRLVLHAQHCQLPARGVE